MVEVLEYLDHTGHSPFQEWFDGLDAKAAVKINTARMRLSLGNWSNVKGVGGGVLERVIDYGPGYRIYFGKDGNTLLILLAGGTKKRQEQDVKIAAERWQDYRQRKKKENEEEKDNGAHKKFHRDRKSSR